MVASGECTLIGTHAQTVKRAKLETRLPFALIYTYPVSINSFIINLLYRLSTTRSTPLLVMCGVMEQSCTRRGVWGGNLLMATPTPR